MVQVSDDWPENITPVHEGKPFFEPLIEYITSAPVVAMVAGGAGCYPGCPEHNRGHQGRSRLRLAPFAVILA